MMKTRRSIEELSPEHQAAVRAFATRHGRKWKNALGVAWGRGTDTSESDGWALRDIRNNPAWGHDWLENVEDVGQ